MPIKITKADEKEWGKLTGAMVLLDVELDAAITAYNEAVKEAYEKLNGAVTAYNEAQTEVREWIEQQVSDWQEDFAERSEKWQEGEKGQAAQSFIEAWESHANELEEVEVDEPDELEIDRPDWQDDELPREPEAVDE